jgi:hypothetical protein
MIEYANLELKTLYTAITYKCYILISMNLPPENNEIERIESITPQTVTGLESINEEQRKKAITAFEHERDIPYRIDPNPEHINIREFPDCLGKSVRLHETLNSIGLETQLCTCSFRWSDCDLPLEVLKVPHNDEGLHVFLLYKYQDEWRILDPTWNPGIRRSFISNSWDGVHPTTLAVAPTTRPEVTSVEQLEEIFSPEMLSEDLQVNAEFYKALNSHFASLEKKAEELGDSFHHPSEKPDYPLSNRS